MADTKISAMPSATALTGTEVIPMVQGGINVQTTLSNIKTLSRSLGAWQSNQNQTGSISAGTPITVNVTDINDGVTANTNAFTVPTTGVYNLQFSAQFLNSENTQNDVAVWVKINGTDLANSAGVVTVPARKSAGVYGKTISGWNYYLSMTAGQYAQLYWQPESANVVMTTIAATATYPGAASIIVTMGQVQ